MDQLAVPPSMARANRKITITHARIILSIDVFNM